MIPTLRIAFSVAALLALGVTIGIASQWPQLSQHDREKKKCEDELAFYRSYAEIEIGMLDRNAERIVAKPPQLVSGEQWPTKLGAVPGYQYGCPASLLLRADGDLDKMTYNPNNSIFWLRWDFADNRWIAVACLGEPAMRNTTAVLVVAKRRSP